MSEYDNTNTGALWKSKFTDNPKSPQYTGHVDIEGVEWKLSAWKSSSDNPKAPVLNFQLQKATDIPQQASQQNVEATLEDDVPF
jgi:hypothetical protein|tara:strand:- start:96 stop:347 length:252 start_codon:yes stop_codon:yes gene_type:complete